MRYVLIFSVFFLSFTSCAVTETREPPEVPDHPKVQNEDDTKLRITKLLSLSGLFLSDMQLGTERLDEDIVRAGTTGKVKLYYDPSNLKMDSEK